MLLVFRILNQREMEGIYMDFNKRIGGGGGWEEMSLRYLGYLFIHHTFSSTHFSEELLSTPCIHQLHSLYHIHGPWWLRNSLLPFYGWIYFLIRSLNITRYRTMESEKDGVKMIERWNGWIWTVSTSQLDFCGDGQCKGKSESMARWQAFIQWGRSIYIYLYVCVCVIKQHLRIRSIFPLLISFLHLLGSREKSEIDEVALALPLTDIL